MLILQLTTQHNFTVQLWVNWRHHAVSESPHRLLYCFCNTLLEPADPQPNPWVTNSLSWIGTLWFSSSVEMISNQNQTNGQDAWCLKITLVKSPFRKKCYLVWFFFCGSFKLKENVKFNESGSKNPSVLTHSGSTVTVGTSQKSLCGF